MILIIGKSGQLASALASVCKSSQQDYTCLGRDDIDILCEDSIAEAFNKLKPTSVINASAYTAVDNAESDYEGARLINEEAVRYLAAAAKRINSHFVHVSTDYVFAGDKGSPYLPDDEIDPINAYGKSKAQGEHALLQISPNNCVIRTSWVYSCIGNNFVKTMLTLMQSKPALTVVDDQIGSPTSANTLARACLQAAEYKISGIYHCTDEGVASWYDFAKAIQAGALNLGLLDKSVPIEPVDSSAFKTVAKRPAYSVMSKASLKQTLPSLSLPYWKDALEQVLIELKNQH